MQGRELPVCSSTNAVAGYKVNAVRKEDEKVKEPSKEVEKQKDFFYKAPAIAPDGYINDVPYITAKKGETYFSVSKKKDMMLWQVLKYNDAEKNDVLREGEIVFLKPKRFVAKENAHVIKAGESLRDIAQLYGIKLNHLYRKNNMAPGQEATIGQKILLK